MQVGLKTTTAHTSAALVRGGIDSPQTVSRQAAVQSATLRSAFPEAALLSLRPLRYNVQLNQQLTAVQQADDYLAQTETRLLQLRKSWGQDDTARQASALQKHLERREQLSGGTIDRYLNAAVQQKSVVNFTLPGSEKLLADPGGETLVFSLGGRERQLAAVTLPQEATPRQTLTRLNTGLGRLGIHAQQGGSGQLTFHVEESRWERVSQQLSVRGEGHNYPADAFTLLAPQADSGSSDEMLMMAKQRERGSLAGMQKTLNHITVQRSQLRQQQERVTSRIDDMATAYAPRQALETSKALAKSLGSGALQFTTLSAALGAQANVRVATVKNLLG